MTFADPKKQKKELSEREQAIDALRAKLGTTRAHAAAILDGEAAAEARKKAEQETEAIQEGGQ